MNRSARRIVYRSVFSNHTICRRRLLRSPFIYFACFVLASTARLPLRGAESWSTEQPGRASDLSFRNEIDHAIERGLSFLLASQNSNGWWSTAEHPAMTALALTGFMEEPTGRYRTNLPPALTNAYAYVLGCVQPDGRICRQSLANYNTAISMMALLAANNPAYENILRRGRAFLVKSQIDLGVPGKIDTPFDGGVGYGDKYEHSDMNNTLYALEAIHDTRHLVQDRNIPEARDLNWEAVIHFLESCQNPPARNKEPWVSQDPDDRGGFVYYPGHSMAGGVTNATTGRVALRSYGSISYAGLLSYIYADLKPDDPRVAAVLDWLRSHYTLEENPGMGPQGYYYYLQLMTKALTAAGLDVLVLKDGRKLGWRREVSLRLLNLQQKDGSWASANGRWWEKDPNLVTAYAVLSLELIRRRL
jgi:squalene-hopene/tetraprenyl-beta-curcumene cyclase